jgi:hypothetical protein
MLLLYFVYQAIDYISLQCVFIIYAVRLIYDIKLFMGELGVAEFGLCVVWCGEERELWSGKGGAQRSVRLGRRTGRARWEFVWATWIGQGKFFGEESWRARGEEMMRIIFGWERWECWSWDSENKFGTEDNGRSWRRARRSGENGCGGGGRGQLGVSSSRNFLT